MSFDKRKNLNANLEIRGQFYQCYTSSFYESDISQMQKKTVKSSVSFCAFVTYARES